MHFQGILNINRISLLAALKFTAFPDNVILENVSQQRVNMFK